MKTKWFVPLVSIVSTSISMGCSIESSIEDLSNVNAPDLGDGLQKQSGQSDFINAEVITTNNGVVFTGGIGELSELKTLPNGVQIKDLLYE